MEDENLNLAITVEQHHSGSYHWVVVELCPAERDYHRLLESSQNFASQADAVMAGCAGLLKLIAAPGDESHAPAPAALRDEAGPAGRAA